MAAPGDPSRKSSRTRHAEAPAEDWATRCLATVVAVPVFAVSLYASLAAILMSPYLALHAMRHLPIAFYVVYLGLAVFVGLRSGMSGITSLLGHLFGTHFASEADRRVTYGLWAGLAAATLIAYALTGGAR